MRLITLQTAAHVGLWAARYIVNHINTFQTNVVRPFILVLPTGNSPLETYKSPITMHKAGQVNFKHVVTFNMDEYVCKFCNYINIPKENINLLNCKTIDINAECLRYEQIPSYGTEFIY